MAFNGQGTNIAQADDVFFNIPAQGNTISYNNTTKKWNNVDRSYLISVRDYGAKGDGVTDDTDAINLAIQAGKGKTIVFPGDATYLIDPTRNTTTVPSRGKAGILLNQPDTKLVLDPGATIKSKPMSVGNYVMIQVTAPNCVIEGGTLFGDVDTHIGSTGEWGFGIDLAAGASNTLVTRMMITKCWGDGIYVRGADDIRIVDVLSIDNRRQGLSIISATRPHIIGGSYSYTGKTLAAAPAAGIDLEPNPGAGDAIVDALIIGVEASNNKNGGIISDAIPGAQTTGTIIGCTMNNNGTNGYGTYGTSGTHKVNLFGCTANSNAQNGYYLSAVSDSSVTLTSCVARNNLASGFISSVLVELIGVNAAQNNMHGISLITGSNGSIITGGTTTANNQSAGANNMNILLAAPSLTVTGHTSHAGTLTSAPPIGINVSSSATNCRIVGSDAIGTYSIAGYYTNVADTFALPVPGAAKQVAIASPNADVVSLKNSIDSIRNALHNLGIVA